VILNAVTIIIGIFDYNIIEPNNLETFNPDACYIDFAWREALFFVFSVFRVAAWFFCDWLLVYQYRKGLSEHWYSHKTFWVLSFIINASYLIWGLFKID
jgi:hypothetical protein